jgi:hypothetical protein
MCEINEESEPGGVAVEPKKRALESSRALVRPIKRGLIIKIGTAFPCVKENQDLILISRNIE